MEKNKAIAFVGLGSILPDAIGVDTFWQNILSKKYSIIEVPPDRWNVRLYYDPDPRATDKTYSKIGAWVREYQFDPLKAGIAIPPKVLSVMDKAQQWAIAACLQALQDYGYPTRPLNQERVAVILGNAMAGENHYRTSLRISLPEYIDVLQSLPDFQDLPVGVRESLMAGMQNGIRSRIPAITEDTMPGELSNVITGRVANVFNFGGPNFVTDAACASSLAALQAAVEGLESHKFDAVLTGGVDRNMGPESFVKFSKIGALSADGSRPYAKGANGFVMGEGAVIFLLKRLEDAERDGDKIYGVVRGIGGSSDGKGKGITAPNPIGQQRAIERAWMEAGISPAAAGLIEGHGTSTEVGDVTEVISMQSVFRPLGLNNHSIALGSVKSNIGHLKSAAGAAGLLKALLAINKHILPPSVNFDAPNPNIDFSQSPFYVNNETHPWEVKDGETRCAGVSSFGFGGTNFHVVIQEYLPGVLMAEKGVHIVAKPISDKVLQPIPADEKVGEVKPAVFSNPVERTSQPVADVEAIKQYILAAVSEKTGYPPEMLDLELDLEADLGIDTVKQAELFAQIRTHYNIPRREDLRLTDYNTLTKIIKFICDSQGTDLGSCNDRSINEQEISDQKQSHVETPLPTGNPTPYRGLLFVSAATKADLRQTLVKKVQQINNGESQAPECPSREQASQPERLAIDYSDSCELQERSEKALSALEKDSFPTWRALQAQGIYHGSGVAGKLAFLFPGQGSQYVNMLRDLRDAEPIVRRTFEEADDVMTPILGRSLSSFIYVDEGGSAIEHAENDLKNTAITQPAMLTADVAILRLMDKFGFQPDMVIGHSLGEYAALVAAGVLTFAEALEVVSARGREMSRIKVDDNGCMAAVSAPLARVEEVLRTVDGYVVIANINSPVQSVIGGTTTAVDQAILSFKSAGFEAVKIPVSHAFHTRIVTPASQPLREVIARMDVQRPRIPIVANVTGDLYPVGREDILDILAQQVASPVQFVKGIQTLYMMGARIFVEIGPKRVLNALVADNLKDKDDVTLLATNHPRKGGKVSFNEALCGLYAAGAGGKVVESSSTVVSMNTPSKQVKESVRQSMGLIEGRLPITGSVVISGAGLGLPGRNGHVFDDRNIESLLKGEMRIDEVPPEIRNEMLEKKIIRLVKSESGAEMEEISDPDRTIRLAGQRGEFNLVDEFGVPEERVDTYDISTQLAVGAGIEALRDAGIPLVMNYRRTSKGTLLPDRWKLPPALQDETGVIFCSAFPGLDRMTDEASRFYEVRALESQLAEVRSMKDLLFSLAPTGVTALKMEMERRVIELEEKLRELDYHFDRRFIFRVLSMGHSQFAEYIGARGPNTHVNAACATTTHAIAIADDWIRAGRCRRVIVIAGDDVTNPHLASWIGTGLLASGAATTESNLRMAALPFDRRRNGMIMGMGAAALVVESEDAVRERGVRAICELLATQIANSAFHGTRLDVQHVSQVMERLLSTAELRFGVQRAQMASSLMFVSHETYTPARGGSASAEIHALRQTFHEKADQVVIANTKGYTGHTMGVGIEDVLAVKALETGIVPPIANIEEGFQPDPELGNLNLSKGGVCNPSYALRLGAGFGSQVAMSLLRKIPGVGNRINRTIHEPWLMQVAGYEKAELEVVQRTLRIKDRGEPVKEPMKSGWQFGQVPTVWAATPDKENHVDEVSSSTTNKDAEREPLSRTVQLPGAPSVVDDTVEAHPISVNLEEIKTFLLSSVSEKTGYPVEMLDLDLDLEADLGIDTVKQAELFAAVRTHYNIPKRDDLRLADYNTLAKVIRFVQEGIPALLTSTPEKSSDNKVPSETNELPQEKLIREDKASKEIGRSSTIKRRIPVPVLRPRLKLCVPTSVKLDEGCSVIVVEGRDNSGATLVKELKKRKTHTLSFESGQPLDKMDEWLREGAVQGAYFLPALDSDPVWSGQDLTEWKSALNLRLETLFHLAKALPENAFLICATRMGGLHGLVDGINPLGGLVSGFAKALSRERPLALIKVVDFHQSVQADELSKKLLDETLLDPAVVEIGWEGEQRFTPALVDEPLPLSGEELLKPGSIFVVSGGTGGITSPVLVDLAKATRGTFFLLGRTCLLEKDSEDLKKVRTNRSSLLAELRQRLLNAGEKATPTIVEAKLAAIERAGSTLETMEAIERCGAKVSYLNCDITDPLAVTRAVEKISEATGNVDVLIHAAGLEKSRKLENKSLDEFRQVVAVKAEGCVNLLHALEQNGRLPHAIAFFSSVAGRFGNAGQTDYSAANDFLSKLAGWLPQQYPGMKCVSIDWGAWAEIGMASRGSTPLVMKRAGIEMLNPAETASLVRMELQAGKSAEVVLAGELGLLEKPRLDNYGLDVKRADVALREGNPIHTMFSHLTGLDLNTGISLEAELDPKVQSYLSDHAMNGVPMLPGVMGIEGFSVASKHIASVLASEKAGFEVARLEKIQFIAPFKFYRNESRHILWKALAIRQSDGLVVRVSLESDMEQRSGQKKHFLHFSGLVYLSPNLVKPEPLANPPCWQTRPSVTADDIYKLYFHGPTFQVLDSVQRSGNLVLGRLNPNLKPISADDPDLYLTPILIELCFQTAGIWEAGSTGALALPHAVGSLKIFPHKPIEGPILAVVEPVERDGRTVFDARAMDSTGYVYVELKDYCTIPLPYPAESRLIEPMKILTRED